MKKKNDNDEISPQIAQAAYRTRLSHLKRAQEHSGKGEIAKSVEHYLTYLKALSMYFKIDEDALNPKLFDEKNITEQLLISQVYWDLAKAYDRNPKTIGEAKRCLSQFVKFSIGFKYQRVNADIIRKHLRKKQARNPELFKETYERIKVTSKACYIATHCYGQEDYRLDILRTFRDEIDYSWAGEQFNKTYYWISPKLLVLLKDFPKLNSFFVKYFFKPTIEGLLHVIRK